MKNRIFGATVALIAAANLAFVGGTAGAATSTDYAPELVYTVADSGINNNNNLAIQLMTDSFEPLARMSVNLPDVTLQDREFFAAIKEGREPNSSVAQVLPCYKVLHELELQLNA